MVGMQRRVLGACHELVLLNGRPCGDPMEVALLGGSGYALAQSDVATPSAQAARDNDDAEAEAVDFLSGFTGRGGGAGGSGGAAMGAGRVSPVFDGGSARRAA